MLTILPRKVIVVLIILFATLNLWLWYFLSFSPPQNVILAQINQNSAVLVWTSTRPTASSVYYSENPWRLQFLPLSFPWVSLARETRPGTFHSLRLTQLRPNTSYFFLIAEGLHFYRLQKRITADKNGVIKTENLALPILKTLNK